MFEIILRDIFQYFIPTILLFFSVGFISQPISKLVFSKNYDSGFINGQIIGLLGVSWITFTIGTILTKSFENNNVSIFELAIIATTIWITLNLILSIKYPKYNYSISKITQVLLLQFFLLIFFYLINSFGYKINPLGSENFMNLGILNSIEYSNKFPINDFWFAGFEMNYYYFGHIIIYLISLFLGLNPIKDLLFLGIIIPTIFLTSAYFFVLTIINISTKIKLNITNKFIIVGVFMMVFLALTPLQNIFYFWKSVIQNITYDSDFIIINNIRVLEYLISENFMYPILYNPLHALTLNLPVGVLILNLIYFFSVYKFENQNKNFYAIFILLGFAMIINTWDILVYYSLFIASLLFFYRKQILENYKKHFKFFVLLHYLIIIICLPWFLYFKSPAGVPGIVRDVTNLLQLISFWGVYIILSLIYKFYKKTLIFKNKYLSFLILTSFMGIFLLEIFYINDNLRDSQYYRANTYYKISNIILLLFSISFTTFLSVLIFKINSFKFRFIFLLVTVIVSIPIYSLIQYKFYSKTFTGNLNQIATVNEYSSELSNLILFLNTYKSSNEVLVEGSAKKSNVNSNYVSVYTGIPTIFGWVGHEITWRNNIYFIDKIEKRKIDVESIFVSEDLLLTQELIKKYKVNYIVISKSEREIYGDNLKIEKLEKLGEVVFEEGETKLIKVIQ